MLKPYGPRLGFERNTITEKARHRFGASAWDCAPVQVQRLQRLASKEGISLMLLGSQVSRLNYERRLVDFNLTPTLPLLSLGISVPKATIYQAGRPFFQQQSFLSARVGLHRTH